MAQPASRQELADYCKRQLGAPVLEINVADEQIDDLIDDALQLYHERHFDGVAKAYLKYQFTQDDIDRGRAPEGSVANAGIATTSVSATIGNTVTSFSYTENGNYLQVPPDIVGIRRILDFGGSNTISNGMFSLKYQMFLNDMYAWGTTEILTYAMTKTYLTDLEMLLNTKKQIRYNQRMDRLYLDVDWSTVRVGDYIVIECSRSLDPNDFTKVWNDSFLKKYVTMLVKKQWGQNLIKFQGVKLPGGIELNGGEILQQAESELSDIKARMMSEYELPPLDFIG